MLGKPDSASANKPTADNTKNSKGNAVDEVCITLTAGAIAGAVAKTAIAPLDRSKINFQIRKDVNYTFRGALSFLGETYKREGSLALWRGNSATMVRIVPYSAIQFTAHEQLRKLLRVDYQGSSTKIKRFLAGAGAGVISQTLTYPLDLARARMAVTDKSTGYKTLRQVFSTIWLEEGPRAFYRGYGPTILGVVPYAGTSFFTYDTLKREYNEIFDCSKPSRPVTVIFGAAAGLVGQTASYPLDIVRRRLQTTRMEPNTPTPSALSLLMKIYKEEGIKRGFYKGLSMNWIKGPIAAGISFSTYDLVTELLAEILKLERGLRDS